MQGSKDRLPRLQRTHFGSALTQEQAEDALPAHGGGKRGGRCAPAFIKDTDFLSETTASGIGTKLDWTLRDRHPLRTGRLEAGSPMSTLRT